MGTTVKQLLKVGNDIGNTPSAPQLCGNGKGIGSGVTMVTLGTANNITFDDVTGDANNQSVCTRNVPFMLEFVSDELEGLGETENRSESRDADLGVNLGFTLASTQVAC